MAMEYGSKNAGWNKVHLILERPYSVRECERIPDYLNHSANLGQVSATNLVSTPGEVEEMTAECISIYHTSQVTSRREYLEEQTDLYIKGLQQSGWEVIWRSNVGTCDTWEGQRSSIYTFQDIHRKYSAVRIFVAYPEEQDPDLRWFLNWSDAFKSGDHSTGKTIDSGTLNQKSLNYSNHAEFLYIDPRDTGAANWDGKMIGVYVAGDCESLRAWSMGHRTSTSGR